MYTSVEEAGIPAGELLQQMEQAGRADVWQEAENLVGPGSKLTRLACVVREKEHGEHKCRLVVGCRRSGANGLSHPTKDDRCCVFSSIIA